MSTKVVAVAYALLMFTSALPVSQASHTPETTPDLPGLPHAQPTDECLPSRLPQEVLVRANQLAGGDPAWYQDEVGVPALCLQGGPTPEWVALVKQLDMTLDNLRNASQEVQRQVDYRLEHTLPDSSYPDDLVEPRTVLLDERFDGRRYTGFGDWNVITQRGEDPLWSIETRETVNGTSGVYRFGSDQGYERGVHQWLVSPEIDLGSLKGNETAVRELEYLRQRARNQLWEACNVMSFNPGGAPILAPVCGEGNDFRIGVGQMPFIGGGSSSTSIPNLAAVVEAYRLAIDSTVYELPVMQHGAFMDLTYRFNLAPGEDGVRLWVYTGDRAPDRRVLYNEFFGLGDAFSACAHEANGAIPQGADPLTNGTIHDTEAARVASCDESLDGGQIIGNGSGQLGKPLPGMARVNAFRQDAPLRSYPIGFTGNMSEFTTARVNLTDLMGERVWLLLEVKTQPNDRGVDIFNDGSRFGRQRDYGFELGRVYVEGAGYHRNLRLKDVGATFAYVSPDNEKGDTSNVKVAIPPGNEPVVVWVHNAGDYQENATVRVTAGLGRTFTTRVEMMPDEVRAVQVPWGRLTPGGTPIRNNTVYHLNASISFIVNDSPTLVDVTQNGTRDVLDPNATATRPMNAADLPLGAGVTSVYQPIRADTVRDLTLLRADSAPGNPIELCSSVKGIDCQEHYAGRKGEQRTILVGVRNDGNAPQDARVELKLELDGVERPDMVVGGATRTARDLLVGEVRALEWNVIPTLPGAYRVILVPHREGESTVRDALAERRMFVQRSTGLICLDTLQERECGPTYVGDFVPELEDSEITAAAMGADGTLYVATAIAEARESDGLHRGLLASRDPATGAWRILANMSANVLNQTFQGGPAIWLNATFQHSWGDIRALAPAPDGSLYLFGDNATALRYNTTRSVPQLERVGLATATANVSDARPVNFTDALWWNGTLLAAGSQGHLSHLDAGVLAPIQVWNTSVAFETPKDTIGANPYRGTITDLAIGPQGAPVLLGTGGVLLRQVGTSYTANGSWIESEIAGEPLAWGESVRNETLNTAVAYEGRLYVAGARGILLVSTSSEMTEFAPVLPPAPVVRPEGQRSYAQLFVTEDRLQLLDSDGKLASCTRCFVARPEWVYEELPIPTYVPAQGDTRIARIATVVDDATRTVLAGEGGLVLDRIERGDYDTDLSWSTVPALAARDGGVIQTKRTPNSAVDHAQGPQSYIGVPDAAGREIANLADSYRLFLNHSVANATKTYPADVKLMYRPIYDTRVGGTTGNRICALPDQETQGREIGTALVCSNDTVRYTVASFTEPTRSDGWVFEAYEGLPTHNEAAAAFAAADPVGLFFYAVEFQQTGGTTNGVRWAIDDVRLQGRVDGQWRDIITWVGKNADANSGDWWHSELEKALYVHGDAPNIEGTQLEDQEAWEEWPYAFDSTAASLWHYASQYADKPVFAANNEFYALEPDVSTPRLVSNGTWRLVSPVLDLADAYDPQVVFRHNYSFRLQTVENEPPRASTFRPADGGTIEISYMMRGEECGAAADADETCGWSPFYTVEPDGGYPTQEEMGFGEYGLTEQVSLERPPGGRVGPERSYWGRRATPDEAGEISSLRDTSTYEEATVTLSNVVCTQTELDTIEERVRADCVYFFKDGQAYPVNLTGRQIRVGFHLHALSYEHGKGADPDPWETERSYPGEGWYITDFALRGASKLGIDLRATNMTLRVGYDADLIGVGPGTRIPVNVTVENKGVFDALGYTGTLQVRRVLDRSLGTSTLVETISLPQQPVLDAGGDVNHTLFWSVPREENAEYTLAFEVEPIGIARDESFLDNIVGLGSTSDPITARTVRRFDPEFLVSPENATADITRYIPMFINNTGNVPLEGFTVERRITQIGVSVDRDATTCAEWRQFVSEGRRTAIVDCRSWTTSRAAAEGARTPLTLLSEQVDPTADLFWKAPARASFLVALSAETRVGAGMLLGSADKRINAFATYLFDDVESGTRGDAVRGSWSLQGDWNVSQPGFRSTEAYGFGDETLGRYAPDANDAIVSPTLDLGSARTARVAFYHNYALEPSFDGGIIEASADGGRTWNAITPIADPLASVSYDLKTPLQAASALHPTGDPEDVAYGFTGDSSQIEGSVDGWVLTQLDLTSYANVTEPDVAYEAYTSVELGSLNSVDNAVGLANGIYRGADWCEDADRFLCWEAQNMTEGRRSPLSATDPTNTFFWSGSPQLEDDNAAVHLNAMLEFTMDISSVETGERVIAEWWEYASRFGGRAHMVPVAVPASEPAPGTPYDLPDKRDVLSAHTFLQGANPGVTWRFNLAEPQILETRGRWYRMQSDLTDLVAEAKPSGDTMQIRFAYTPIKTYAADVNDSDVDLAWLDAGVRDTGVLLSNGTDYFGLNPTHEFPNKGRFQDDPGFAIDGLRIEALRFARGEVLANRTLLDEGAGYNVLECGIGGPSVTQSKWAGGSTQAAACMDNNKQFVRAPIPARHNVTNRTWSIVSEIPSVQSSWQIVDVLDQNEKAALPTGEVSRAWWTGDVECRHDKDERRCTQPGSEGRLITPAVDLGSIAGDNAWFTFWHRYGFYALSQGQTYGGIPLASGGVVEIQEFNAQTNTWSDWKQIYSDSMDANGGYSAKTSNVSRGTLGVLRGDMPFEGHAVPGSPDEVQYLYSGNSHWIEGNSTQEGAAVDGWLEERFDVREYLGKRVRFGFHYALNDYPSYFQAGARGAIVDPDGNRIDENVPDEPEIEETAAQQQADNIEKARGGWWIGDIKIVGDVLVGQPVQLRWRAASDGNVQDGRWKIDDVGVYGSRYKENVGLFVDTTELKYGAYPNSEAVIPLTIRNLGESVRRDLAIEIVKVGATPVELDADAPAGTETVAGKFILKGFTLAPGQSATVDLRVRTKAASIEPSVTFIMRLKEQSPVATGDDRFAVITDNEVQGLLQREVKFGLQRTPRAEPVSSTIRQVTPSIGETVEMDLVLSNPGYGPSSLNMTCKAYTVTEHVDAVHATPNAPDTPVIAAEYPCSREGDLTIAAKGTQGYVLRATPTKAGHLTFEVNYSVVGGTDSEVTAGTAVGVSPFTWTQGFDRLVDVTGNYSDGDTPGLYWSYLRGHDAPGALLLGVDENSSGGVGYAAAANADGGEGGCGAPGQCRARSKVVDLHNYSEGSPAFLSFWHMDRFAKNDGAQVRARILLNEQKPGSTPEGLRNAWTEPCVVEPIGGYEGRIRQTLPTAGEPGPTGDPTMVPGDANGVFVDGTIYDDMHQVAPLLNQSPGFFVADGGRWEETWSLAAFDLSQPCKSIVPGEDPLTLVGKTVRFEFGLFTGSPTGELNRGIGHGWLIDDIVVSPYALSVRPEHGQTAGMLDNSTKGFNVIVTNLGATPDVVRLEFDAANSSAPEGSVVVPADAYFLAPGESRTLTVEVTLPRDPSLLPSEFRARVLARSTIDRNAVGATVLDLVFGPRQWAELSLVADAPAGVVQEGTEAFIPVTIENVGLVDSVASRVLVVDEWDGGRTETSLDLASIPSYQQDPVGAVRVLEFRWRPEEGSVGAHTLTFEVDPDALGEEYTRTNNRATLVVPVSDLLIPDLKLDSFSALTMRNSVGGVVSPDLDADVARYEVTAGEVVSFDVKVANPGRAGATNVDVRAFLGSLALPPKQVPYVAPGSEVVVTFVWLAQKGEYEVEFLARSEQVELSIDNNRYPGLGVTLLTVKGYEVEVEVPALTDLLEPGTEVSFAFSISNSGNAGEDLVLRATSPPGTRVQLPREGFFLRPGETYTAEARLLLDDDAVAGEQLISIDAIARENPMKVASGKATMRVNASYAGSVVGGVGVGVPTEILLPIDLVNEGNSLEPWTVRLQLPAGWSVKETLPAKVSVPAHDRKTVEFHVIVPATTAPGDRMLRVSATMPNGEVREGNARVQVSPLRAALLQVQDDAPVPERGALRIPIEVENKGNVQQPFSVVLTSVPEGVQVSVSPETFDLAPGEKTMAALVVRADDNVTAGTYAVTGYTRFEGVIVATPEGLANVQTLRLPIVRQDLALGAIESTPRAGVQPGDRVSVKVPVHNRGLSALTDIPVHLFVDDVFVAEVILATLDAGARVDATFNWTAVEGVHTLTAVVDPYEDTVDADRADNAVSQLATVGDDASASGGVAAGRADTPGIGLVGLLAALAVGVLLTRGNGSRRQRR